MVCNLLYPSICLLFSAHYIFISFPKNKNPISFIKDLNL
jgi:hypothetical protein